MSAEEAFDDAARLAALRAYDILDTPPDEAFDNVTALCAELLHVPIALVSLVDEERQWFKSRQGLDVAETERSVAFCDHAIREPVPMVVEDASQDERFRDNPLVIRDPRIRFYAGVQLRTPDGHALGTLCAIDRVPRSPTARQMELLARLARQVEVQLELHRRTATLQHSVQQQAEQQRHKEELATMLVHDLRTPMTGIALASLSAEELDEKGLRENMADIATLAQQSQRMLADVLDICLAQGGDLTPRPATLALLDTTEEVVHQMSAAATDKGVLLTTQAEAGTVEADPEMLRRMLVNLVDNALQHAPPDTSVELIAQAGDDRVQFVIADQGPGVPEAERELIFQPHMQSPGAQRGRGLGLAFSALAAQAHGGRLWVEDNQPRGSRFVLELPSVGG